MFTILCRFVKQGTVGKWFPIWSDVDGADTAAYLKQNVQSEDNGRLLDKRPDRQAREYMMVYGEK